MSDRASCLHLEPEVAFTPDAMGSSSHRSLMVGVRLTLEYRAVEVSRALVAAGIPSILLKGPSFIRWLYDQGDPRTSADIDLLVPPKGWGKAGEVLRGLGFESPFEGFEDIPLDRQIPSCEWSRATDGAIVDLHQTLIGSRCAPYQLWEVFNRNSEEMLVGTSSHVRILNVAGRAFHVAAHHAQHPGEKSEEDLRRALRLEELETWREAAKIARDVEALDWFTHGLRLLPEGRDVIRRLQLPAEVSVDTVLLSSSGPSASLFLQRLSELPSAMERLTFLGGKIVPPPSFMRTWNPMASRGRLGLMAAYVLRPFILLSKAPRGFFDWRRAVKRSSEHS